MQSPNKELLQKVKRTVFIALNWMPPLPRTDLDLYRQFVLSEKSTNVLKSTRIGGLQ